jgi:hypothetical protein
MKSDKTEGPVHTEVDYSSNNEAQLYVLFLLYLKSFLLFSLIFFFSSY